MSYQIVQADPFWDCVESMRHDDPYKAHLTDAISELRRQPFHNPRLQTHDIGLAGNGRKLFSSDVGGRASDRRIVWQLFRRTILLLLYGTHKVQDRARRMRVDYDSNSRLVQVFEQGPASEATRPHTAQKPRSGKLFMAWTDGALQELRFPEPAITHLRGLNTIDELFDLEEHLGMPYLEQAFELLAGERPGGDQMSPPEESERGDAPIEPAGDRPSREASDALLDEADGPAGETADGPSEDAFELADPPEVTPEDVELERLLNDERTGAAFTRIEPEFMADVIGQPIEDWMIFIHPDQRAAATRKYNGPARVRGAAGTGKTVVGLHRAVELAARPRATPLPFPEGREQSGDDTARALPVLFTTFIKTLPPVFKKLYHRIPGARKGAVNFINIDKLAADICWEGGRAPHVNETKVDLAFREAIEQIVVPNTPLYGKFTWGYLRDEIKWVIKGRALESRDGYLDLVRTGRRTRLGPLQRTQVWELMECWDWHMERHGTVDFSDRIVLALRYARQLTEPRYSAVIVDEAQDLTLAGLQLLRSLVNAPDHDIDRPDGLFVLGDGAQSIYPGGFTLRQAGVEVRGRTTRLTTSYRNTREIIGAAMAVAGESHIEDLAEEYQRGGETVAAVRTGPPPQLVQADGQDQQIDAIIRRINDLTGLNASDDPGGPAVPAPEGFVAARITDPGALGLGDLAVLAPRRQLVNKAINRLRAAGLNVQNLEAYDGRPNDKVKVGTYHRAKGLEFKAVFVIVPSWFPSRPPGPASEDESSEDRDLKISALFVAMTRARDLLVVVAGSRPATEIAAAVDHFDVVEA